MAQDTTRNEEPCTTRQPGRPCRPAHSDKCQVSQAKQEAVGGRHSDISLIAKTAIYLLPLYEFPKRFTWLNEISPQAEYSLQKTQSTPFSCPTPAQAHTKFLKKTPQNTTPKYLYILFIRPFLPAAHPPECRGRL